MSLQNLGYCGVDCSLCPDYLRGVCPDCRRTPWPEDDPCLPVGCCRKRGIQVCGLCPGFPCPDMAEFYAESEGHRQAYARMRALEKSEKKPDSV